MRIDTTLFENDRSIIEGLATGRLRRFGSVVRDASNGRIVKHLLEAPQLSEDLMKMPTPSLVGGVGTVVNAVGDITTTLSSVLHVSQVAAAASVLNLGVSAVGFAYMGFKLNQLQKAMSAMQERMDARFDRVDAQLEAHTGQLNYLLLLAEANAYEQQRLSAALAELHRAVLLEELAEVRSWLDHFSRFPEDLPKDAIRAASRARQILSDQAVRVTPEFEPRVMLVADISIRGWVVATATEANLLMQIGKHRDARQVIENEHPRFAALAEQWAKALLADPRPQLQTAYRFEAPRFRSYILPERVERIVRIHDVDRELSPQRRRWAAKEAALELEMSHNAQLDTGWTHRQLAIAEYLDGLSELASRLETLGAFAHECETRRLRSSRDVLPGPDAARGIYLLPASDADNDL
jgi:hypothetical protein